MKDNQLKDLTNTQLNRLYGKIYNRIAAGGQLFGLDWRTIRITNPHLAQCLKQVGDLLSSKN